MLLAALPRRLRRTGAVTVAAEVGTDAGSAVVTRGTCWSRRPSSLLYRRRIAVARPGRGRGMVGAAALTVSVLTRTGRMGSVEPAGGGAGVLAVAAVRSRLARQSA